MILRRAVVILAIALAACNSTPIVPDAQSQLADLGARYSVAHAIELANCNPPRVGAICGDDCRPVTNEPLCESVRRAGYDAEAAYVTANAERTAPTLAAARGYVEGYRRATLELRRAQ